MLRGPGPGLLSWRLELVRDAAWSRTGAVVLETGVSQGCCGVQETQETQEGEWPFDTPI